MSKEEKILNLKKENIEAIYKVSIWKARRGYYYSKELIDGKFLSKDYSTLEAIEEVLEMKRKANLIFKEEDKK